MGPSEYHEALWRELPEDLEPAAFGQRLAFLMATARPGQRALDVGCGEGAFAAELAAAGVEVVGLDVAEEPLRRARARHPGLDLRLLSSETGWELPDSSFDLVWAGEVIEHVADTAGWLSELRRVLRSGGALALSTPALGRRELLRAALSRAAFAGRFDPRADHLHFYSAATLRGLLEEFGFEEIEISRLAGSPALLLCRALRSRF
jgi:2-polyprenyl-6-hydroxyphenyl methylase/3-demethylubiquinone-9 3-methyltransferase